ncbi:MAG TPA: rhamnulokinase [Mobilitalea sp.]|nr:rhamnulokinase [Mobilitalea sp.]
MPNYYLAIDIGASGGRHILGSFTEGKISLEEVYRFENGMEKINGSLCWNTQKIFQEIIAGMKKCKEIGKIPISVGIDTWGVDFVLLDNEDKMIGNAVGYRDHRTQEMPGELEKIIEPQKLYERTGIQSQVYNTIYQLMAIKKDHPEQLEQAKKLLFTPDYYHFLLSGEKKQEYTIASTSMLVNVHTNAWDYELIEQLGFPAKLFKELQLPGTPVGSLRPEIRDELGYDCMVVAPASHDTASAVAAVPSTEKDTLYISSGTWSLMGIETNTPNCSEECRLAGFTNEGGYNYQYRMLKNIMGLWMIQSVRKEIGGGISYGELCEKASRETIASIVNCNDSSFLAPESMVEAVQEYCRKTGQQVPQTLPQIASVIYNSLASCYATALEEIERLTGKYYKSIHIIGGGSNAAYLNELTARYTGRTVVAGPSEATAIGNLVCQMLHNKEFSSLEEARKVISLFL